MGQANTATSWRRLRETMPMTASNNAASVALLPLLVAQACASSAAHVRC